MIADKAIEVIDAYIELEIDADVAKERLDDLAERADSSAGPDGRGRCQLIIK